MIASISSRPKLGCSSAHPGNHKSGQRARDGLTSPLTHKRNTTCAPVSMPKRNIRAQPETRALIHTSVDMEQTEVKECTPDYPYNRRRGFQTSSMPSSAFHAFRFRYEDPSFEGLASPWSHIVSYQGLRINCKCSVHSCNFMLGNQRDRSCRRPARSEPGHATLVNGKFPGAPLLAPDGSGLEGPTKPGVVPVCHPPTAQDVVNGRRTSTTPTKTTMRSHTTTSDHTRHICILYAKPHARNLAEVLLATKNA